MNYGRWQNKIEHLLALGMPEASIPQKIAEWELLESSRDEREDKRQQMIAAAKSRIGDMTVSETVVYTVEYTEFIGAAMNGDTTLHHVAAPVGTEKNDFIRTQRQRIAVQFGFENGDAMLGAAEEGDELGRLAMDVMWTEIARDYVRVINKLSTNHPHKADTISYVRKDNC